MEPVLPDPAATDPGPPPSRRRRRRWRVAGAIAIVMAMVLGAVWLARRPLVTRFVNRELVARGVPARYRVAAIGPGGQRLEAVVIGDPANPDLTADWIETETGIGWNGPYLAGVRAGHVRLRGRVVDGRVSLGAIDRLLPPPSGKPFALPALHVRSDDVRMRLETPAGVIGLKLAGAGRLDDGFAGTVAMVAPRLDAGGCVGESVRAAVRVRVTDRSPSVAGPVQAAALRCGPTRIAAARADVALTLGAALDRLGGQVRIATGQVGLAGQTRIAAAGVSGTVVLNPRPIRWPTGTASLMADGVAAADADGAWARADRIAIDGRWSRDPAGTGIGLAEQGAADRAPARIRVQGATLAPARLAALPEAAALAGTPLAPLAARATRAVRAAARRFDLDAQFRAQIGDGYRLADVEGATVRAANGAQVRVEPAIGWRQGPDGAAWWELWAGAGGARDIAMRGGGLPSVTATIGDRRRGQPWRARIVAEPYAVAGARIAVSPVAIRVAGGRWRVTTAATLSGPVAGGRVDGLVLPVRASGRAGDVVIDPICTPVAAGRLAVSGLVLDAPRVTLCPRGGVLLRAGPGGVTGGAHIAAATLNGRLGTSPLALRAAGTVLDLAGRGFAIEGLAVRLGAPERETRLSFATLNGALGAHGVAGAFTGGGGQIGAVPLRLADAAGDWRLSGGVLTLNGALGVSDTASPARFQPMRGGDVRLTLADGAILAIGTVREPTTGTKVAEVRIGHALASGRGSAVLDVPGLTFAPGFQPELLTRVTFGVIADVRGTVSGRGDIAWGPDGVRSTGRFATAGTDLAAAFGPVQGIAGTIAFDDLLGLRSAPGQRLTIRSVNPGIEVTDGVIRYRTLSGTQVQIDNGHWPFAGGTLTLAPTLLDFGQDAARRMTFAVTGAAADKFLQQFSFDNLNATGTFDGTLPMIFDQSGGRIADGRLQVRPGGGSIAYAGDLTQKDLGFWGNLAFQSLRSLRYRDLSITMNGPLSGEMVTAVRFAGVSQGEGAKSNFLIRRLQRLPLVFNIRIAAPFRGLLDSARGFYDPSLLIRRNLPALIEEQRRRTAPVQPPASEPVP